MRRILGLALACAAILAAILLRSAPQPDRSNDRRDAALSVRHILRSQDAYRSLHPAKGFAATLAELGPPPGAGLIDAELAGGAGFGYRFTLTPGPTDSSGRVERYTLDAFSERNLGYRFFADESTFIRWSNADSPTMSDGPLYSEMVQDGIIGFTPDGQSVAIISGVRVKLVDVATGKEALRLTTPVEGLSFGLSDDGRVLAWRVEEMAQLWDISSGREVFSLARTPEMQPLAFSSNGQWLAGTTQTQGLKVWNVAENRELRTLSPASPLSIDKNFRVKGVTFSANGRSIVASGEEEETSPEGDRRVVAGVARAWDVTTGTSTGTVRSDTSIQVADLSADGTRMTAKSGPSVPVVIWDIATGKPLHRLVHSPAFTRARSIAFSPDGHLLATSGEDNIVKFWDTATGQQLHALFGPWGAGSSGFDPSGTLLFARGTDEGELWDTTTWRARRLQKSGGDHFHVRSAAFSPDGSTLAASDGASIEVWDAVTGKEMRTLAAAAHNEITFSRDGRLLIVRLESNGAAGVLEAESGTKLHTIESGNPDLSLNGVFSPEHRWLGAGDRNGTIKVWEVATGRLTHEFDTPPGTFPVSMDANGRFLAALQTPNDGTIQVWDVGTGMSVGVIHSGPLEMSFFRETIRLSPDGQLAAVAQSDSGDTFRTLDVTAGRELYTFARNTSRAVLSPDGRTVATTTSRDGEVRLLDAATGAELRALKDDPVPSPILGLSFSRDGRWLASYGADNILRLWNVTAGRLQSMYPLLPGRP